MTNVDRHAFQSLVWNLAASERVDRYGREGVVEGDLVFPKHVNVEEVESILVDPDVAMGAQDQLLNSTEAAGEGGEGNEGGEGDEGDESDVANTREAKRARKTQEGLPEVHVVTQEDVKKGIFDITDVVLPMPG